MKQLLIAIAAAAIVSGCTTMAQAPATAGAPDSGTALAGMREMKMAFDITDGDPKALLLKLTVIDLTRKQLIEAGVTPRMVIGFRGDASYFTQGDLEKVKPEQREDAKKVAAKIREISTASGIETLEQCSVPLPSRKLKGTDVMPEIKLVQNGWISLAAYQARGYSYIVP